jgi:hypothetical protein
MAELVKRVYSNFRGVDFANEASLVNLSRSPDALNVWKNYNDAQGECIETRPGLRLLGTIGNKILGIYALSDSKAVVHSGKYLYSWNNFPDTPMQITELFANMNINNRTSFNKFGNYLYINDGDNYLRYDGTTLSNVSDNAYIPTTTIGRSPSGGGEMYQDVNLLSNKRINQFTADGTSVDYVLDAVGIDSVNKVVVNDVELSSTAYSVNTGTGVVTFNTAPTAPAQGQDNVYITFTKTTPGYQNRISNCKKALIWDNRMFFTGNASLPNVLFHCKLNDPTYISDLAYYEDGNSDSAIKDIVVGSDVLWVFKNKDQNNANVFYHTKTTSAEAGNIYPNKQGNIETGCYSVAINFLDDIVYLSKNGLQGIITAQLENKQIISPRSHFVNSKMINNSDYYNAQMENWNGYLLVLVGDEIYLADSRQKTEYLSSYEYEWYLWKFNITPSLLKCYNGKLYMGDNEGNIYCIEGTNDNGQAIESYWTTPMDNFKYPNHYKTTNKRGGIAKLKSIQNGKTKLAIRTERMSDFEYLTQKNLNGFNFGDIDFENFSFENTKEVYLIYKIKKKKIHEISLKFYSDELDKPFGIYSIILEAFIGGYVKK